MLQTQQEVFLLSDETVAQVVQDVVCHIGRRASFTRTPLLTRDCLYHASEEMALLDMLASFAEISSSQLPLVAAQTDKQEQTTVLRGTAT